jgi:hypothetical protein
MKKLLVILPLLFLGFGFPSVSHAAIAYDNSADSGALSGTTLTYSYTVGTGSNRLLFISFYGGTTDTVTGVTYNGVSATLVGKVQTPSDRWAYMYYLVNPASGANNIAINSSISIVGQITPSSYTGASQTAQPDAYSTNTYTAINHPIISLTTVADNSWTIAFGRDSAGYASTGDAGSTERQDSGGAHLYDSNGPITPAGSTSLGWTYATAGVPNSGVVMASFSPAVSSPSITAMITSWITWIF